MVKKYGSTMMMTLVDDDKYFELKIKIEKILMEDVEQFKMLNAFRFCRCFVSLF